MLLADLTASARRLALVGLAKNTGKTVALAALVGELDAQRRTVGVTSVGRDGEERDAIDFRIGKPRVHLRARSLIATTDALLRDSGIPHELLEQTDVRTPLGRVMIARLLGAGRIEVAGPSAAADVRAVSDAMLGHGAEQVLIDGAIDRRAASSPAVADGLVISTGAVLSADADEVVQRTRDAVELVRLSELHAAARASVDAADVPRLILGDGSAVDLPPRFVLAGEPGALSALLDAHPSVLRLFVPGALPEAFVREAAVWARRGSRELELVALDPTRVFLAERGPGWYAAQGLHLSVLKPISLRAVTINPLAPQSHSFDSAALRGKLRAAIEGVPIIDVLHPQYTGARAPAPAVS